MTCDIPTVAIEYKDFCLIGLYREWRIPGVEGSGKIPLQAARFRTFVDKWKEINMKTCCLGDFNFDLFDI